MRLKPNQISKISELIIKDFKEKKIAIFIAKEDDIKKKIIDIFKENLDAEERLEEEVNKILDKFSDKFSSGEIDYKKMFDLTKKKVAVDKKFVL